MFFLNANSLKRGPNFETQAVPKYPPKNCPGLHHNETLNVCS